MVDRPGFGLNPEALESYADDLDRLVERLARVLDGADASARFRSPSCDPASLQTARRLAADAGPRSVLGGAVRSLIDDLRAEATVARLNARAYRELDQGGEDGFRKLDDEEDDS